MVAIVKRSQWVAFIRDRSGDATRAVQRRWIRLISADWLPALHRFVAGLPRSSAVDLPCGACV